MENEQIKVTAGRRPISEMGAYNSDSGGCPVLRSDVVDAAIADELLRALVMAEDAMAREGFGTITLLPKLRAAISAATNGSKT